MAKSNSRYIQFYTPGSVACKVEIRKEHEWAPLPQPKPEKRRVIAVDPIAAVGFLVSVCMLVLMAFGIQHLNQIRKEVDVLENYVVVLSEQNAALSQDYEPGYSLEEVRQKALDMGMVPQEEVPHTMIHVEAPTL